MNRAEIEHVLRAAAAIAKENSFVLIGSQVVALLLDSPPSELLVSADGVGPETAALAAGWMERAKLVYFDGITAVCPEIHDLAASKCAAGRDKDADFVRVLLRDLFISLDTLLERVSLLPMTAEARQAVTAWVRRRAAEAQP